MRHTGKRSAARVAIVLAALAGTGAVSAATLSIADAISIRKANFKEIGGAFKTINDEIKTGAPDTNTVRPLAKDLARRAALVKDHFPAGSGPESGIKTKAKAEIWSDRAAFDKLAGSLVTSTAALERAAKTGDLAAMTKARNAVGGTCKSCHTKFREKD